LSAAGASSSPLKSKTCRSLRGDLLIVPNKGFLRELVESAKLIQAVMALSIGACALKTDLYSVEMCQLKDDSCPELYWKVHLSLYSPLPLPGKSLYQFVNCICFTYSKDIYVI